MLVDPGCIRLAWIASFNFVLFTLGNIFVFVVVLMVCFVIFDFALSDATWIELLLMRP